VLLLFQVLLGLLPRQGLGLPLPFLGFSHSPQLFSLFGPEMEVGGPARVDEADLVAGPAPHPGRAFLDGGEIRPVEDRAGLVARPLRDAVLQQTTSRLAGGDREPEPLLDQRRDQVVGESGRAA